MTGVHDLDEYVQVSGPLMRIMALMGGLLADPFP